jgi:WD40 repeat protein
LAIEAARRHPSLLINNTLLAALETSYEHQTLTGHDGDVYDVQFSPNARRVISASSDKTARIWDCDTGKELLVLRGHEGRVVSARFSKDGRRAFTVGADRTARLWDAVSGKQLFSWSEPGPVKLPDPLKQFNSACLAQLSTDGSRAVTAFGSVRLWDCETGEAIAAGLLSERIITSVAFSPDGSKIVTTDHDPEKHDGATRLWDTHRFKIDGILLQEGVLKSLRRCVYACFAPNGQTVLVSEEGVVGRGTPPWHLWDGVEAKPRISLHRSFERNLFVPFPPGYEPSVRGAFSPDGKRLSTIFGVMAADLWSVDDGKHLLAMNEFQKGWHQVLSLAFSADSRTLAGAGTDRSIRIWDTSDGKELAVLRGHRDAIWAVAFSPDGRRIVSGGRDKTVRIWDVPTSELVQRKRGVWTEVKIVLPGPQGHLVLTRTESNGGQPRAPSICRINSGTELLELQAPEVSIAIAWSTEDGTIVIGQSDAGSAVFWDTATGKRSSVLKKQSWAGWSDISPDGKWFVTVEQGAARVLELATGAEKHCLKSDGEMVMAFFTHVSNPARIITTEVREQTTMQRIWDPVTGQETRLKPPLGTPKPQVATLSVSRNGRRIVSTPSTRVWDADTGQQLLSLDGKPDTGGEATLSPDGTLLITTAPLTVVAGVGVPSNTARVWDSASGKELFVLRGHSDIVNKADISPDGRFIVTASLDKTARLWDAQTGEEILTLKGHTAPLDLVGFTPDAKYVVTHSTDQTVRIWPTDLINTALSRLPRELTLEERMQYEEIESIPR